jgi:dTDP-glucose 4,6-dehydratase
LGKDFEQSTISVKERLGQDAVYEIDSTRSRTELGWDTRITLEEGLRQTVLWIEKDWPVISKSPWEYHHAA